MLTMQQADFQSAMNFTAETMEVLAPLWVDCGADCPTEGAFLPLAESETWYLRSGADPELLPELRATWEQCRKTPELVFYGWLLFQGLRNQILEEQLLPLPEAVLRERSGWFFVLLILALYPEIEKLYREKGIPQKYVWDCCTSLPGLMKIYHTAYPARHGVFPIQFEWMTYFLHGTMYRIGRLEYLMHPQPAFVPVVFRSRKTGRIAALCPETWQLGNDGFLTAGGTRPEPHFTETHVTGIPVSPCGKALIGQKITLALDEFERIDRPGEMVPSCHIPVGGSLTPETVVDSMRQAVGFFRQYLHCEVRIFCCDSWLLSPEWAKIMPDSNIAKFQQLCYLTPWYSRGTDGMFFLFGCWNAQDWTQLNCRTSLQKAYVKQHFENRRIGTGGMFILTEDLPGLKANFYRERSLLP